MSGPHPTISAWERDAHDGCYRHTMRDWKLTVTWSPNTIKERGAFHWKAEHPEGGSGHSHHGFEEMSAAMADAEAFAIAEAAREDWQLAQSAE